VICTVFFCLILVAECTSKTKDAPPKGPGFAFSGAGGRIAQHAALMEVLVKGLYPQGKPIRPAYITGASSGSISAVALNAILQYEDNKSKTGFTWDLYKELLFAMNSSTVYDDSWEGLAKVFTINIFEGYFSDNTRLENLLGQYLALTNYKTLGDLYIPTCISIVNQSSGLDTRVCSTDPQYMSLDLLQVIMASTALPMAFTPRTITGLGDAIWIDGGTGIDTIPVYPLLANPYVTEVYLICYGDALTSGGGDLPYKLDYIRLLKNGLAVINDMRVDLYAGAIDMAKDSSVPSFTYMPNGMNTTFSALDFDQEKLEFEMAYQWAITNNPTRLNPTKGL